MPAQSLPEMIDTGLEVFRRSDSFVMAMNWLDIPQSGLTILLAAGGLILLLLLAWRLVYTIRAYRQLTQGGKTGQVKSHYLFGAEGPQDPSEWGTPFTRLLQPLVLKNEPFPPANAKMLESLISFRFPFTRQNIGTEFPEAMKAAMETFPPVLIQLLYKHKVPIELDVVCDIPAMMDPNGPKLMFSKLFTMDDQLFHSNHNPIYPYGLPGMILHELGHFVDWFLDPETGRLSATSEFLSAVQEDVQAIDPAMIYTFEMCNAFREQYGGYLKLPKVIRYRSDLSMFVKQEEEVFGEAFLYLMSGGGREIVIKHFPKTILAVEALLTRSFEKAALEAHKLSTP
jgi:hypothetical protein